MKAPLDGVRIVSFEWIVVGPWATSFLGSYGATVIKVESIVKTDEARYVAPFKDGRRDANWSAYFSHQNCSKLSVTINLRKPAGRELALRLIKEADVVLENMTPGVMKSLGLGYEDVKAVKPDIIYISNSVQGQFGPHAYSTGFGQLAAALAGLINLNGWSDRGPALSHGAYVDYVTGRLVPSLILAALDYHRRTGQGQYIDNSILENTAYFYALPVMDFVVNRRIMDRNGNRDSLMCPHGAFRCKGNDRWVALAVSNDAEWAGLCKAMGQSQIAGDPRFATFWDRKSNETELEELIGRWTAGFTAEEVEAVMQKAGVPSSVVESTSDLFRDEQLQFHGFWRNLEHKAMGTITRSGPASKFSTITDVQTAAPLLGEHNDFVMREILHLSESEIADFIAAGAIG